MASPSHAHGFGRPSPSGSKWLALARLPAAFPCRFCPFDLLVRPVNKIHTAFCLVQRWRTVITDILLVGWRVIGGSSTQLPAVYLPLSLYLLPVVLLWIVSDTRSLPRLPPHAQQSKSLALTYRPTGDEPRTGQTGQLPRALHSGGPPRFDSFHFFTSRRRASRFYRGPAHLEHTAQRTAQPTAQHTA